MNDDKSCETCAYEYVSHKEDPCVKCSKCDSANSSNYWAKAGAQEQPATKAISKTAQDLLKDAFDTLNARGVDYDKPAGERSMAKTVAVFNLMTDSTMTEEEGWQFMKCLKQVRNWSGDKRHADSMVDDIAYSALLAECATNV